MVLERERERWRKQRHFCQGYVSGLTGFVIPRNDLGWIRAPLSTWLFTTTGSVHKVTNMCDHLRLSSSVKSPLFPPAL